MENIEKTNKFFYVIIAIGIVIFLGFILVVSGKSNLASLNPFNNSIPANSGKGSVVNGFTALQTPTFKFPSVVYAKDIETKTTVYNADGQKVEAEMAAKQDDAGGTAVQIINSPQFTPGKYKIEINDGSGRKIEQDFAWGVLAINPDKATYRPGESAFLSLAVLDEKGKMVCDASVKLEIRSPKSETTTLSTENGLIKVNPECNLKKYTEKSDYETTYKTSMVGNYEMVLTAITKNGTYTIKDFFTVANNTQFEVQRLSATRIFPASSYPVKIIITANQDFTGQIKESIPASFKISELKEQLKYEKIEENGETNYIVWDVALKKGQTINLGYKYNAPIISPQFYLIGALGFYPNTGAEGFRENRFWQIASDDISYSTQVIATPGVISYWRFGEASGTNADDEVSANDGTYTGTYLLNTPGGISGDGDGSFSSAGAGYVSVPHNTVLNFTTNFSLEAWVYANSGPTGASRIIFSKGTGNSYFLSYNHDSNEFRFGNNTGTVYATAPAGDSAWHHVVATYGTLTNSSKIYVDGIDVTAPSSSGSFTGNTSALTIASENGSSYWDGRIDEPAVYNVVLTSTQILQHYNAGVITYTPYQRKAINTPGLVSYWRLGESSGHPQDSFGTNHATGETAITYGARGAIVRDSNTALSLNGSTSYVSVPDNATLDLGDTAQSYELWFRRTGNFGAVNDATMYSKGTQGALKMMGTTHGNGSDKIHLDQDGTISAYSSVSITDTNWHHLVAVHDTTAATQNKIYIDGVDVTVTGTNNTFSSNASSVNFGKYSESASEYFTGEIDEIAVYNTALTPTQVSEHFKVGSPYAANIISTPGLVCYWRLNETSGTTADDLMNNCDTSVIVNGPTLGVTGLLAGDPNTAMTFVNASHEFIDGNNSAALDLGDGPLTLEAWVKSNDWNVSWANSIFGKGTNAYALSVNTTGYLVFSKRFVADIATSTVSLTTGEPHHVVATKNGSAVKLYVDGVDVTGTVTNQTLSNTTAALGIGASVADSGGADWIDGTIDEPAIYNVVLTPAQVKQHFYLGASQGFSIGGTGIRLQGVRIN